MKVTLISLNNPNVYPGIRRLVCSLMDRSGSGKNQIIDMTHRVRMD